MWIFCGGMYRSGSTLQFQLTAHLVEAAGVGRRVEWTRPETFDPASHDGSGEAGLMVFKTHRLTAPIADELSRGNAKGVYIYRDIRDVCISWMGKTSMSFRRMIRSPMIGECLEQYEQWTTRSDVLVSRYETVIDDLAAEVARIAGHLGVDVSDDECTAIADEYSLERQRERTEAVRAGEGALRKAGHRVYDEGSLLHGDHIRSGEPGLWRRRLGPAQVSAVERRAGAWLDERGYEVTSPDLRLADRLRLLAYGV